MSAFPTVPPAASGSVARTDGPIPLAAASRPASAARAETARALQPVDGAGRGLDIRFEDRQGRPVGPPPAFQVSLLQAMREAARESRFGASAPGFAEPGSRFAGPDRVDRRV